MTLTWEPREPPLPPAGLAALGTDVEPLRRRLLRLDGKTLAHLSGVAGEGVLAILGPHEWLPWSPGVVYFGAVPDTPSLLLPTTQKPNVPAGLLLVALQSTSPQVTLPIACLPSAVFSLTDAAPLTHAALEAL